MRDTRTTAQMVLARLRADAPSDTRGVDGKQARRHAGPAASRPPRQGPRVRRHREPGRLVTTVNAATASSIEESGPALR